MRTELAKLYDALSSSYWFIPAVMALAAAVLAVSLVWLDGRIDARWIADRLLIASEPAGATAILSAIGGSMIGVAGTVFSVTIAAVVYASGQYGPRLLTNFMSDRGNQVTLGVFTATFVYSILVLRSVRNGSDASGLDPAVAAFVPDIALLGAIALALCSIGVLIYFVHHVPANIHISNVIDGIGRTLLGDIRDRFPGLADEAHARAVAAEPQLPACFAAKSDPRAERPEYAEVVADETGYLQFIDETSLIDAATEHDLIVRLACRPGGFVHAGRLVFDAYPLERVTEEARADLVSTLAVGSMRTPQDLLFLIDELVEITARALSPAVNDPFTAITCMDWMGAALDELARRGMPSALRVDGEGQLRIVGTPVSFPQFLHQSFGNVRQYVSGDLIAASHFLASLARIAPACQDRTCVEALRDMGQSLIEMAARRFSGEPLEELREKERQFHAVLHHPRFREPIPAPVVDAEDAGTRTSTAGTTLT